MNEFVYEYRENNTCVIQEKTALISVYPWVTVHLPANDVQYKTCMLCVLWKKTRTECCHLWVAWFLNRGHNDVLYRLFLVGMIHKNTDILLHMLLMAKWIRMNECYMRIMHVFFNIESVRICQFLFLELSLHIKYAIHFLPQSIFNLKYTLNSMNV